MLDIEKNSNHYYCEGINPYEALLISSLAPQHHQVLLTL